MTEAMNGFCTCYPDRRSEDCGVAAHRREARDNDFADAVKGLARLLELPYEETLDEDERHDR